MFSEWVEVVSDESGESLQVQISPADRYLLTPYARIHGYSQNDPWGVVPAVLPCETTENGLKFSREGALYDLEQQIQPNMVDKSKQPV